jgi:ribosome-binding protein aMBF1 (putative translation factor)
MDKRKTRLIVSSNLKRAIISQKLQRTVISKELNIKYNKLCDWIRGRTMPKENELKKLADYLGLDIHQVYEKNIPEELSFPLQIKMIKEELNKQDNTIKINDEFYIKKENIERIINNE